jgi:hypothetical protein
MQFDQKQLFGIAQDYPWFMFTGEEIALLCNVSRDFVTKVKLAADSPFCLNKCRPEWFANWMREHPDFQLSKAPAPLPALMCPICLELSPSEQSSLQAFNKSKKVRQRQADSKRFAIAKS